LARPTEALGTADLTAAPAPLELEAEEDGA
jgi:hypothetical protein